MLKRCPSGLGQLGGTDALRKSATNRVSFPAGTTSTGSVEAGLARLLLVRLGAAGAAVGAAVPFSASMVLPATSTPGGRLLVHDWDHRHRRNAPKLERGRSVRQTRTDPKDSDAWFVAFAPAQHRLGRHWFAPSSLNRSRRHHDGAKDLVRIVSGSALLAPPSCIRPPRHPGCRVFCYFDESGDFAFRRDGFDWYTQAAVVCPESYLAELANYVEGRHRRWAVRELHASELSGGQRLNICRFIARSPLELVVQATDTALLNPTVIVNWRRRQAATLRKNLSACQEQGGHAPDVARAD